MLLGGMFLINVFVGVIVDNFNRIKNEMEIGGSLMKFKLFLGFAQCISFFPVTFTTIPWSSDFVNLSNVLKLFAVDLFAMFGAAACELSTGFYQEFVFSVVLLPLVVCGAGLAYAAAGGRSPVGAPWCMSFFGFLFLISCGLIGLIIPGMPPVSSKSSTKTSSTFLALMSL